MIFIFIFGSRFCSRISKKYVWGVISGVISAIHCTYIALIFLFLYINNVKWVFLVCFQVKFSSARIWHEIREGLRKTSPEIAKKKKVIKIQN